MPRGQYVWLVGPDGSGKSTLAQGLDPERVMVKYWRVGVFPMARQLAGRAPSTETNHNPHARQADSILRGTARLVYYAVDNLLGFLFIVLPARRRGTTVVVDRGWADMVVDPSRYGLRSPRLARFLGRLLPSPDAIAVAAVDPKTAHNRKPELPVPEIERQYKEWRKLKWRSTPVVMIDNQGESENAVRELYDLLASLAAK